MGLVLFTYGILLMIGSAAGSKDMMQPLKGLAAAPGHGSAQAQHLTFKNIKGIAGLQQALDSAKAQNKTVMLDFYADWCISCKEMERFTFTDAKIKSRLKNVVLLQVDVTAGTLDDDVLLKHFKLFGPPGILFFDRHGRKIPDARVIGYQNTEDFLAILNAVLI